MSVYKVNDINYENDVLKIKPSFKAPNILQMSFSDYINSLESIIKKMLNHHLFEDYQNDQTEENLKKGFSNLYTSLPIIKYFGFEKPPACFSFVVLCVGEYTHGVGRFVADMLCKWLIPGKQLALHGNRSLNFNFPLFEDHQFYITEYYVQINDAKEYNLIKNNIDHFISQIRLNILSVYHARQIDNTTKLSFEEKSALIKENISSLLDTKHKFLEKNAFDQMHNFITKLSAEKNLSQIKANLNNLMVKRPKSFDRDIFESIYNVSMIFRDKFTAHRQPLYVSRLISLHYLFKKTIKQKHFTSPKERHISIKLLKTHLNETSPRSIIGILLCMNFVNETERFDQKHLIQAIKSIIKDIEPINDSFIVDKRDSNMISIYLEIEKKEDIFSFQQLKTLKKKLPYEIKDRIESVINPIFMPRNEEEVIRNIILLSKQLKYVRDMAQVIITYEKQTSTHISFNVILLRLLKDETPPLKEYFIYSQTSLKYLPDEIKIVGSLKKKYPKEANIFRLSLKKTSFYRKDYSLDLQKARNFVVKELVKVIGDFRDYNGGMILKQSQALDCLKKILPNHKKSSDFLLENFFYSLKPAIMQSILDTEIIKSFYSLFLKTLKLFQVERSFEIQIEETNRFFLIMIASSFPTKEKLQNAIYKLKIPSYDLTYCFIQEDDVYIGGYILRSSDKKKHSLFHQTIKKTLEKEAL